MDANDLTIATYDRIAGEFARLHFDEQLPAREVFARAITGPAPPGRFRILDAGCGPGRDAKWFHDYGFPVIGIDRSSGMVAEAQRRVPEVEFRQADLRHLDFPPGYFDGVWCSAALLHLSRAELTPVLEAFNRILGHGWLWLSLKLGEGEEMSETVYGRGNPRRFTYVNRYEVELYLERTGFEVRQVWDATPTTDNPHPFISFLAQTELRPPLQGAAAVVFDASGRVLLSERSDGRGWNLPAGFVDRDEGPAEAVVREVEEETGLLVQVERLIGLYTSYRRFKGATWALVSHAFLCHVVGGELTPTNEALQHGWFAPHALPAPMSSHRHVDYLHDAIEVREGRRTETVLREYRPESPPTPFPLPH